MTLLLLAGTGEGRKLAEGLDRACVPVIASLAGVTEAPKPLPVPTRVGGFGGEEAFREYLKGKDIKAVLDATHPFANAISLRAAKVAAELDLPYCQLLRPAWLPEVGDFWTTVASPTEAVARIAAGARVFLATGRKSLPDFMDLAHSDVTLRVVDPVDGDFPLPHGRYLVARPPFSLADERATFEGLGIDTLVVKNAGGAVGRAKLQAARDLGIRVIMIERPVQPAGLTVDSVEAALDWALQQKLMP
ncbi:cobalt-precorrin-6A reductase [Thalassovita mediterranea]|jgi:precorrin-6A/cobalt-precorrin-6A reductase|uniref:Precorrin-6A reductase n=1 Tax=Thalassovita mediterranea TaxID=340021 RepID=A0A0P1H4C2_9RHOB|nr:cobalt-precorrin-6A reductase [Thalassovita mediterranea]CUH84794.1 Precorrin-6A reductase [Thalassovita mediterranea]SIS29339.1 precorrin-6A/cobalt-precorrin-6A reductase [Thalassovita mediterranea]